MWDKWTKQAQQEKGGGRKENFHAKQNEAIMMMRNDARECSKASYKDAKERKGETNKSQAEWGKKKKKWIKKNKFFNNDIREVLKKTLLWNSCFLSRTKNCRKHPHRGNGWFQSKVKLNSKHHWEGVQGENKEKKSCD